MRPGGTGETFRLQGSRGKTRQMKKERGGITKGRGNGERVGGFKVIRERQAVYQLLMS